MEGCQDIKNESTCHICMKVFVGNHHLYIMRRPRHMRNVHRDLKFKCETCKKEFKTKEYLKIHINSIHEKTKTFECKVCSKLFYKAVTLLTHKKQVHENRRKHECEFCSKSFVNKVKLKSHIQSIHESKKIHCDTCGKDFAPSYLDEHVALAHGTNNMETKCETCDKTFKTKKYMKRHATLVHTKLEKIWKCKRCSRSFSSKTYLRNHNRQVHNKEKHKCVKCEKQFTSAFYLKHHFREKHTNVDVKIKCKLCNKKYFSKSSIITHKHEAST